MFALEGRRDCRRVIHRRKEEEEEEEEGERGLLPSYSLTYVRFSFDTALFSPLLLRPPPPPSFNDFFHPLATEILEASTLMNPFPWCKGHPLKRKNIGGREKKSQSDYYPLLSFLSFSFSFFSSSSTSASSGSLRKSKYRGSPQVTCLVFYTDTFLCQSREISKNC